MSASSEQRALHLSLSNEHYTPRATVDAAREVLDGRIDLDPASCELANKIVGATKIYTRDDDGLAQPWHGNVFLNPPGGKVEGASSALIWWRHLLGCWFRGDVGAAIFIGFSLEILRSTQAQGEVSLDPFDFPFAVPRQRMRFLTAHDGALVSQGSPTHANVIVFLPRHGSATEVQRFAQVFAKLGRVALPTTPAGRAVRP
jgi:hypothetical protein